MNKNTKSIRTQTLKTQFNEHSTPLFLTSSFVFEDAERAKDMFFNDEGPIYSRYHNPTVDELVEKICMWEEAEDGLALSSGMAAIFSTLAAHLKSGDHIVAARALFGSALQIITKIFPSWGIEYSLIDGTNQEEWEKAVKPNTKLLFVETPSNPGLEIMDLDFLGKFSKQKNLTLVVDNCFATPVLQNPLRWGADLVIHSATKAIDGQGRVLGGLVAGSKEKIEPIRFFVRHTGPTMSAFNAWILTKSLETIELRVEKISENAYTLAKNLEKNPSLHSVNYPFLESHPQMNLAKKQMKLGGGILTIDLKGGFDAVNNFSKKLKIVSISSNLGDSRTIMTHPASTTHSKLSEEDKKNVKITEGLVRISVGLESIDDLIDDINKALKP